MSGIRGYIVVTDDCRVLCKVSNILTLLPMGPDLVVSEVCFTWIDSSVSDVLGFYMSDDFSGRSTLDFDPAQVKLELVGAEINPIQNKLWIL